MGLFEAYTTCIKKYALFKGRARRSEYWFFVLGNFLISTLLSILLVVVKLFIEDGYVADMVIGGLSLLYSLFVFLPGLAVCVRRLHDTGHSGAFLFLSLIPLVGPIILLVFYCTDSDPGENQYGPNPKKESGVSDLIENRSLPQETAATTAYTGNGWITEAPVPFRQAAKRIRVTCVEGPFPGAYADGESICVGRDAQRCQLTFQNIPGVSRLHCMLRTDGVRIEVCDLHSSYGTYLADGTRLEADKPYFVENESKIYLGSKNAAVSVMLI